MFWISIKTILKNVECIPDATNMWKGTFVSSTSYYGKDKEIFRKHPNFESYIYGMFALIVNF